MLISYLDFSSSQKLGWVTCLDLPLITENRQGEWAPWLNIIIIIIIIIIIVIIIISVIPGYKTA